MKESYAKYLLEKTQQDYNLIAEAFSSKREEIWPELKFLFENYLREGERVLDLGCGNGRFYEAFKGRGISYIGGDISEKLIAIARNKYPGIDFQVINALWLPFSDSSFDKVYSIAVFHHLPSKKYREQFLKEVKRVLKPGGLLFLTVWNLENNKKARALLLKYTLLKMIGLSHLDFRDIFYPWKDAQGRTLVQRYFHCFTKRELKKIFTKAGFKIEKIGILGRGRAKNFYLIARKP